MHHPSGSPFDRDPKPHLSAFLGLVNSHSLGRSGRGQVFFGGLLSARIPREVSEASSSPAPSACRRLEAESSGWWRFGQNRSSYPVGETSSGFMKVHVAEIFLFQVQGIVVAVFGMYWRSIVSFNLSLGLLGLTGGIEIYMILATRPRKILHSNVSLPVFPLTPPHPPPSPPPSLNPPPPLHPHLHPPPPPPPPQLSQALGGA